MQCQTARKRFKFIFFPDDYQLMKLIINFEPSHFRSIPTFRKPPQIRLNFSILLRFSEIYAQSTAIFLCRKWHWFEFPQAHSLNSDRLEAPRSNVETRSMSRFNVFGIYFLCRSRSRTACSSFKSCRWPASTSGNTATRSIVRDISYYF